MPDLPPLALSIRQPWAWAILHAGKDVENRTWPTSFRGPVCIHAGMPPRAVQERENAAFNAIVAMNPDIRPPHFASLPRGGIVGTVEIVGCVRLHSSRWYAGPWAFVLRNPQPVPFLPCRGALGLFDWQSDRIRPALAGDPSDG